ncbi:MAG: G5 domain-containing protein [Clostridia bacterium]|nr:G5 domain-containing protein [Clostridia bacterium]
MKKNIQEKASLSIMKIICISIILILMSGIGVLAVNKKLNNVKILLRNGYEMTVLTSKTKVSEILEENNILLEENEKVVPGVDEEVEDNQTIEIKDKSEREIQISKVSEETIETSLEDLLDTYAPITEKIVVEQVAIPFETITKEATGTGDETRNKVIQNGQEGLKEITYKIKYQKDVEIEKTVLSEVVVKEPVNKIVQVQKITSRAAVERDIPTSVSGTVADYQAYAKQRCYDYGWSDYDFNCLVKLWNRESGWRVTACNRSSGAYGIPQALPASKMASAGPEYRTNYMTQINWGLSYISGRYGSPSSAWNHSQSKGWY